MLKRALVSGGLAAACVTLTLALAGRRHAGSAAAPVNAISHVFWGGRAARADGPSLRYTGTGLAANYGAAVFWALLYEALPGRLPALARGAATSAIAYGVDYHLVPKRFTPGFELRLPNAALAAAYAAMALGLATRDLLVPKP